MLNIEFSYGTGEARYGGWKNGIEISTLGLDPIYWNM
jgi:hypothetical protein